MLVKIRKIMCTLDEDVRSLFSLVLLERDPVPYKVRTHTKETIVYQIISHFTTSLPTGHRISRPIGDHHINLIQAYTWQSYRVQ
jgi:hypothetical protein